MSWPTTTASLKILGETMSVMIGNYLTFVLKVKITVTLTFNLVTPKTIEFFYMSWPTTKAGLKILGKIVCQLLIGNHLTLVFKWVTLTFDLSDPKTLPFCSLECKQPTFIVLLSRSKISLVWGWYHSTVKSIQNSICVRMVYPTGVQTANNQKSAHNL